MDNSKFSYARRKLLKSSAATALLLPTIGLAMNEQKKPNFGILGQQAPELEVTTWIDGKGNETSFKLADHKGKFVFMEFWQYWCPGCHSHGFPGLKKISDAFKDSPHFAALSIQTVFEGSLINTKSKMDDIQDKYGFHDIVMGHETGEDHPSGQPSTMINYRSGGTPWAVIIAPDGKVIFNDFQINVEDAIDYLNKEIAKLS